MDFESRCQQLLTLIRFPSVFVLVRPELEVD